MKRLNLISPVDGRYYEYTEVLKEYFSEYAYLKYRFNVEIDWLNKLNELFGVSDLTKLNDQLSELKESFSLADAEKIKEIEKETNHDVKAIEYFIRHELNNKKLNYLEHLVHFGLTSEDVNNLAIAKMVHDFINNVYYTKIKELISCLRKIKNKYKDVAMLSHTHGQPATPTTVGKEMAVYIYRLESLIKALKRIKLRGKFSGAVGNFAALVISYPNINWLKVSKEFVESEGLEFNPLTTQIESHDMLSVTLNLIKNVNNIIYDFNQDMWLYISNNYFKLKVIKNEVGSSVMPHKVNPINFENSMANLKVSNGLVDVLVDNLQISRMQRDLSDSSLQRNLGSIFGYFLISIDQSIKGLNKSDINKEQIKKDLMENPEIISEAIQTILRKNKDTKAYEKLKELTRGKKVSLEDLYKYVNGLDIDKDDMERLLRLKPDNYIGISKELSDLR